MPAYCVCLLFVSWIQPFSSSQGKGSCQALLLTAEQLASREKGEDLVLGYQKCRKCPDTSGDYGVKPNIKKRTSSGVNVIWILVMFHIWLWMRSQNLDIMGQVHQNGFWIQCYHIASSIEGYGIGRYRRASREYDFKCLKTHAQRGCPE